MNRRIAGSVVIGVLLVGMLSQRATHGQTVPASAEGVTLRGAEVGKVFEQRYGIWFVGEEMPAGVAVELPGGANAEEAIKLLRTAMTRNMGVPKELRVAGAGAANGATNAAADSAWGYEVAEVSGSQGKVFALRFAVAGTPGGDVVKVPGGKESNATDDLRKAMSYENATVETVIQDMAREFGLVFVRSATIPQRVTIQPPFPVTWNEAVAKLNEALLPLGYTAIPMAENPKIFYVLTLMQQRTETARWLYGRDADQVPAADEVLRLIVPLNNVMATGFVHEVPTSSIGDVYAPEGLDVGANAKHNCLILTGPAALVRDVMQRVVRLDANPQRVLTAIEYHQLTKLNAVDVAKAMNAKHGVSTAPAATQSIAEVLAREVYCDADSRTNTVIINGPAEKVKAAVAEIEAMEAAAGK